MTTLLIVTGATTLVCAFFYALERVDAFLSGRDW